MRERGGSAQIDQDIARLEKEIEVLLQERLCYEAQILRVSIERGWISNYMKHKCLSF